MWLGDGGDMFVMADEPRCLDECLNDVRVMQVGTQKGLSSCIGVPVAQIIVDDDFDSYSRPVPRR